MCTLSGEKISLQDDSKATGSRNIVTVLYVFDAPPNTTVSLIQVFAEVGRIS